MGNYTFNYNIDTTGMVKVSVMRLGLIFNAETIKALGAPKKINIGLDTKNKVLGIRASSGDISVKEYDFVKRGDEKWIRVNSKPLVKAIEGVTKSNYTDKMQSYTASFDDELKMLIVDLSKK